MADKTRTWNGGLAITALCSVQFVDVLGVTVVVAALPKMLASLGAPASSASLVSGGYAMFFGGLLMLGARLGDRFGHRRTITAGLAVFAAGALLGAVASSVVLLTAARCLQGAAAAASVPSALRLLTTLTADGPQRRRAIAVWSAAGASAGASGFVVGGIVTDLASWRLVFGACLPLAAALTAAVVWSVPRDRGLGPSRSLNAAAAAVFTAAVMAVVVGTDRAGPARPAGRRRGHRLVRRTAGGRVHQSRPARRRAVAARGRAADTAAAPGSRGRVPQHRGHQLSHDPGHLVPARHSPPQPAPGRRHAGAVQPGRGGRLRCCGARAAPDRAPAALATGLAVIAVADAALIPAAAHGWALSACVAVAGAGLGLSSVAATTLGTTVPGTMRGTASGIINTAAQLGTAVGIAVLLLIAAATTGPPAPGTAAPVIAWAAAAAVAAAGALVFTRSPQRDPAAIVDSTSPATDANPEAENTPASPPR